MSWSRRSINTLNCCLLSRMSTTKSCMTPNAGRWSSLLSGGKDNRRSTKENITLSSKTTKRSLITSSSLIRSWGKLWRGLVGWCLKPNTFLFKHEANTERSSPRTCLSPKFGKKTKNHFMKWKSRRNQKKINMSQHLTKMKSKKKESALCWQASIIKHLPGSQRRRTMVRDWKQRDHIPANRNQSLNLSGDNNFLELGRIEERVKKLFWTNSISY